VELLVAIRASHVRSDGTYSAPRVLEDLREAGYHVGRKRIARLLRHEGLCGVSKRRGPVRPVHFVRETPNAAGFLYLAVVLDVCSRRVIGWADSRIS
jgi:putative transposase